MKPILPETWKLFGHLNISNSNIAWLIKMIKKTEPALIGLPYFANIDVTKLESQLIKHLQHGEYIATVRFLRKIIIYGGEHLHWNMKNEFRKSVKIKSNRSLYTAKQFIDGQKYHDLQKLFMKHLGIVDSPELIAIEIIWSAILFGGFQGRPIDLLRNLKGAKPHPIPTIINQDTHRILWHPDIITALLINRTSQMIISDISIWIEGKLAIPRACRKFRESILRDASDSYWPNSISNGISISRYFVKDHAPAFLTHDQGDHSCCTAISASAWNRLAFGCRSNIKEKNRTRYQGLHKRLEQPELTTYGHLSKSDEQNINDSMKIFSRIKEKQIKPAMAISALNAKLEIIDQQSDPFAYVIIQWCRDMLMDEKAQSTVSSYLSTIQKPLFDIIRLNEITFPPTAEEWNTIFEELFSIGAKISPRKLIAISAASHSFQISLIRHEYLNPDETNVLPYLSTKQHLADANLISFEEMDLLFAGYSEIGLTRETLLQQVCASLGFYCGMRASEILNLRIKDIMSDSEFRVMKHDYSSLKSPYSERVIPSRQLLSPGNLSLLDKLLQMRKKESPENFNVLLFAKPDNKRYGKSTIINPIMKAIRDITGDGSLRFHHLRHSFSNWLFIKILATVYPVIIDPDIRAFRHPTFRQEQCNKLAKELLFDGYKWQFQLSCVRELLGHADESTTMISYLHLIDYLKQKTLQGIIPKLTAKHLSILTGQSMSTIYKQKKSMPNNQKLIEMYLLKTSNPMEQENGMINSQFKHPERKWAFLPACFRSMLPVPLDEFLIEYDKCGANQLSDRFLVPKDIIDHWAVLARHIIIRNKPKYKSHRPLAIHFPKVATDLAIDNLKKLSSPPQKNTKLVRWALKQFYASGAGKNFHIYLKNPAGVKTFIQLFRYLGYSKDNVVLRIIPTEGLDESDVQSLITMWAFKCNVSPEHVIPDRRRTVGFMGGAAYLSLVDWNKLHPTKYGGSKSPQGIGSAIHFALEVEIRRLLFESIQSGNMPTLSV